MELVVRSVVSVGGSLDIDVFVLRVFRLFVRLFVCLFVCFCEPKDTRNGVFSFLIRNENDFELERATGTILKVGWIIIAPWIAIEQTVGTGVFSELRGASGLDMRGQLFSRLASRIFREKSFSSSMYLSFRFIHSTNTPRKTKRNTTNNSTKKMKIDTSSPVMVNGATGKLSW